MWTFEPGVVLSLVVAGALYAWTAVRAARAGSPTRWANIAAFSAGWLTLVAALVSPLDHLSESLFSAHMVQHELLMVVAAPLMVWGTGAVVMGTGAVVMGTGAVFQHSQKTAPVPITTAPAIIWLLHAVALWVWHLPALFDAALENDAVHAAQHLSFFGTAVLFWWGLAHKRYGRSASGAAVLYVFTTAIHSGALGALLTFSPRAWYEPYAATTAAFGLTPLDDQQLGGLIMWVPAGLIYIGVGLAYFAAWIRDAGRGLERAATLPLVCAAVLGCAALTGCRAGAEREAAALTGGDPRHGRDLVRQYGCDTCHTIPGVRSARGLVGPPLTSVAARVYIAGHVPNTPANMMSWIQHPHAHEPHTAMPEMGVPDEDARDLAAYLYTLR